MKTKIIEYDEGCISYKIHSRFKNRSEKEEISKQFIYILTIIFIYNRRNQQSSSDGFKTSNQTYYGETRNEDGFSFEK